MTWLNLAGFALRPGYGFLGDQSRIDALWPLHSGGLFHKKEKRCLEQWWILWRRVAGGLSQEQQMTLYLTESKHLKNKTVDTKELLRLLVSLERLTQESKIEIAQQIISEMQPLRKVSQLHAWALGRIGSRVLLAAEPDFVLNAEVVRQWFVMFESCDWSAEHFCSLAPMFVQVARLVADEDKNLCPEIRERIVKKLRHAGHSSDEIKLLNEFRALKTNERETLFGEKLPSGLYF